MTEMRASEAAGVDWSHVNVATALVLVARHGHRPPAAQPAELDALCAAAAALLPACKERELVTVRPA